MRLLSALTLVGFFSATFALAADREVAPNQSSGYQLARRVVMKEKQREATSPALWMSTRAVKTVHAMAYYQEETQDRAPAEN